MVFLYFPVVCDFESYGFCWYHRISCDRILAFMVCVNCQSTVSCSDASYFCSNCVLHILEFFMGL